MMDRREYKNDGSGGRTKMMDQEGGQTWWIGGRTNMVDGRED